MASGSIQKKLEKIRPPRVSISYDVELGGTIETRELPFVMGVLGDFAAQSEVGQGRLGDRSFIEVTPENLDGVMASMKPRVAFNVSNKLSNSDEKSTFNVDLTFESMSDLTPEKVAQQVEPLRRLLQRRQQLANMRANFQTNEALDEALKRSLTDDQTRDRLKGELGTGEETDGED